MFYYYERISSFVSYPQYKVSNDSALRADDLKTMVKFIKVYVLFFSLVIFFPATVSIAHNRYHTSPQLSSCFPTHDTINYFSTRLKVKAPSLAMIVIGLFLIVFFLYRAESVSEKYAIFGPKVRLHPFSNRAPPIFKSNKIYVLFFSLVIFFPATVSIAHNRYHEPLQLSSSGSIHHIRSFSTGVKSKAPSVAMAVNSPFSTVFYLDTIGSVSEGNAILGQEFRFTPFPNRAPPLQIFKIRNKLICGNNLLPSIQGRLIR
jgi:hypothetical protein